MKRNHRPALRESCRAAALLVACAGIAAAASRHVQAGLVAEVESVRAGQPFWVALHLKMEPGWHTYWKNPGDSGLPTRIKWTLPDGFAAGPIEWPHPEPFSQGPVTSYGYEHEVLLPVQITPPATLAAGRPVAIAARFDWLDCKEACLPGRADLVLTLPVTPDPPRPARAWAAAFAETRKRLPADAVGWTFHTEDTGKGLQLVVRPPKASPPPRQARFFPEEPATVDHAAPQKLALAAGGYRLDLVPASDAARPLARLKGVLVVHEPGGATRALRVDAPGPGKRAGGLAPPSKEEQ